MSVGTDPRVGTEILDYRLEALVGRGGMGVVYRRARPATKTRRRAEAARSEYAADERFRERFLSETERAASLEHPNVIPIHDAGEVDGQLYLAMRLADGGDLKKLLAAQEKLDARARRRDLRAGGAALDAAHDPGSSTGTSSRRTSSSIAAATSTSRTSGSPVGSPTRRRASTPAFRWNACVRRPEQIEGKEIDGRADQYSLACLLHECLTGRPPFARASDAAVLFAHLEEPPPGRPGSST